MGLGVLLGLGLVLAATSLLPSGRLAVVHHHPRVRCVRSLVIPVEWLCGNRIYYTNPDGSRVFIGKASEFKAPVHPMAPTQ
jgi:hypothetical protein